MKVTLTDQELVDKVNDWVKKLAESGGRKWTLEVPVNLDKDPDVLIVELGQRLLAKSQPSAPTEAASGCLPWIKASEPPTDTDTVLMLREKGDAVLGWYRNRFQDKKAYYADITHWMKITHHNELASTPEAAKEQGEIEEIAEQHAEAHCEKLEKVHELLVKDAKLCLEVISSWTYGDYVAGFLAGAAYQRTTLPASTALNDERAKAIGGFICDKEAEGKGKCSAQCIHCSVYYDTTLPTPPKK